MIYLFNESKELLEVIGQDKIISLLYERELNSLYEIKTEFPIHYETEAGTRSYREVIEESMFLGHYDKEGRFQLHKIIAKDFENGVAYLGGIHIFFDELKAMGVVLGKEYKDIEAHNVAKIFNNVGWNIYHFDTTPPKSFEVEEVSYLTLLYKMVEVYGIDFDFSIDFDGQKVISKKLHIFNEMGKDSTKRYHYGTNILSIKGEEDFSEIYTSVIAYGKEETDSETEEKTVVTLEGISVEPNDESAYLSSKNSLELIDTVATSMFGYIDGEDVSPRVAVVKFSDAETQEDLLEEAKLWLQENNTPKAVFTLDVVDSDDIDLGDKVHVLYDEINLYKQVRVSKVFDDLVSDIRVVEFGDTDYFESSKSERAVSDNISATNKRIDQQNDRYSKIIYDLKQDFDKRFEEDVKAIMDEFEQAKIDAFAEIEAMEHRFDAKFERELSEFNTKFQDLLDRANQFTKEEVERITRELRDDFDRIQNEMGDRLGEFEREDENIWNKLDEIIDEIPTLTEDEKHADGLKKEIADLRSEIEDINARPEREREEVRDEISEEEQRLEDLRAEIEKIIDERNRDYRLELSRKEQDLSDLEDEIAKRIEDDKDDLQQQIKAKKKEIQALKNAYAKRVEVDSQLLAEYRSQLTDFVQQINAHRNNHVDELRAEQSDKRSQVKELEEYVEEIKEHARQPIRAEIKQLEDEIERVQEEKLEIEQHFEDVKNAVVEKLERDKERLTHLEEQRSKNVEKHQELVERVESNYYYNPYLQDEVDKINQAYIDEFDEKFRKKEDFIKNLDTNEVTRDYAIYMDEVYKSANYYYYYYYRDFVSGYGYDTTLLDEYADTLPKPKFESPEEIYEWFLGKYSDEELENLDYEIAEEIEIVVNDVTFTYAHYFEEFNNFLTYANKPEIIERLESEFKVEQRAIDEEIAQLKTVDIDKRLPEVKKGNIVVDDLIGVEVDGMNLLIGTDECSESGRVTDLTPKNRHLVEAISEDTEYTMSLGYVVNNTKINNENFVALNIRLDTRRYLHIPKSDAGQNFNERLSKTFRTRNSDLNINDNLEIRFGIVYRNRFGDYESYCRPKLELGATATPWKPHPTEIEAYLEKLDEQVKELSEKISKLQSQLEEDIDITDVEYNGTPAPEDIPNLLNDLNSQIDSLEDRIKELLSWQLVDHKDYTDAIKLNNREKYIADTSEFEEINRKISELLKHLDSMTPDEQSQLEALNNQLQALEKQLADVSITSNEQRQVDELQAEIERLKRLIESRPLTEQEINSINVLQENIKILTSRLNGITDNLTDEERKQLSGLNGAISGLTDDLKETEKRINPLIEDVYDLVDRIASIEKTQDGEIAKLHSVESDVDGITRRLIEVETTQDSEIAKTNDLKISVDGLSSNLKSLENKHNSEVVKTNKLSQSIDATSSRLTSVERAQSNETERISQVRQDLSSLTSHFRELTNDLNNPNNPVLKQLDIKAGIDGFYVRNQKVLDGQTMAGYIMATENSVSNGVRDALTDNDVTINNAGVKIGSKQLTGSQMASSIVVSPQAIDLISRNINIDGNLNVLGKIQAESAKIAKAEIADAYISKLTANTVDTIHLKSEAVTATKLKVDNALANKLIANYVLSNHIETKSIEAVNGRFGSLFAQYIRTVVIEADQLRSSTALFDKVFASDAYIRRLTSQTAFIRDIQAIDLTANRVQVAYNNISNSIRIVPNGLETLSNGTVTSRLNGGGHHFYHQSNYVGHIGTGAIQNHPNVRGLRFTLDNYGQYMAFSYRTGALNPDDPNEIALLWSKGAGGYTRGFHFNENVKLRNSAELETRYIRPLGASIRMHLAQGTFAGTQNGIFISYSSINNGGLHLSGETASLIARRGTSGAYASFRVGEDATKGRVYSTTVYNRTYSSAPNMYITSAATLGRSVSAKKYKVSIEKQFNDASKQLAHSKQILKINPKTWFDKTEAEIYAKEMETGEKQSDDEFKLKRHFGMIADEFDEVGLKELVQYDDKTGEVEGLAYDRIPVHLIVLIKDLYKQIEELKGEKVS